MIFHRYVNLPEATSSLWKNTCNSGVPLLEVPSGVLGGLILRIRDELFVAERQSGWTGVQYHPGAQSMSRLVLIYSSNMAGKSSKFFWRFLARKIIYFLAGVSSHVGGAAGSGVFLAMTHHQLQAPSPLRFHPHVGILHFHPKPHHFVGCDVPLYPHDIPILVG